MQGVLSGVIVQESSDAGNRKAIITTTPSRSYSIICQDESVLKIDEKFVGFDRLGRLMAFEFARFALTGALLMYEAKNECRLGTLTFMKQGVKYKDAFLPWSQLQKVQVNRNTGNLNIILQRGKYDVEVWAEISPKPLIANYELIKLLFQHFGYKC